MAENEVRVAEHLRRGLCEAGYSVDIAADGAEALRLAESHPYDAMVLDVMMPGQDGISALRPMRRKGPNAPATFLTPRYELEDRLRGLDAGADDDLAKPFSMAELLARFRAVLRR